MSRAELWQATLAVDGELTRTEEALAAERAEKLRLQREYDASEGNAAWWKTEAETTLALALENKKTLIEEYEVRGRTNSSHYILGAQSNRVRREGIYSEHGPIT
eukprot:6664112-Pyramimonas_sp.AAC.1